MPHSGVLFTEGGGELDACERFHRLRGNVTEAGACSTTQLREGEGEGGREGRGEGERGGGEEEE